MFVKGTDESGLGAGPPKTRSKSHLPEAKRSLPDRKKRDLLQLSRSFASITCEDETKVAVKLFHARH